MPVIHWINPAIFVNGVLIHDNISSSYRALLDKFAGTKKPKRTRKPVPLQLELFQKCSWLPQPWSDLPQDEL